MVWFGFWYPKDASSLICEASSVLIEGIYRYPNASLAFDTTMTWTTENLSRSEEKTFSGHVSGAQPPPDACGAEIRSNWPLTILHEKSLADPSAAFQVTHLG